MTGTEEIQSNEDKIIALLEKLSTADIGEDKDSDPNIGTVLAKMWGWRRDRNNYDKDNLEEDLVGALGSGKRGEIDKLLNSLNGEGPITIDTRNICNHFIKKRKGRPFRSAATFVGSVLFPLEFITKDIFLCFKALNDGLSYVVPALKVMSKYLPWVAGASFLLEGLCMLADDAQEGNTDKSRKIEACLYLLGGATCIALAVLAPQAYLALLVAVWGISVGIYTTKSIITLMGNYEAKDTLLEQLKTGNRNKDSFSFVEVDAEINSLSLSESQRKYLQARVAKLKSSKEANDNEANDNEVNCTLAELTECLDPYQGFLQTIKHNSVITNAYLVFSFTCVVIGSYAPEAAFVPATVGYIVSTCAVVAGRISNYFRNPSIREAQENPFISSAKVEKVRQSLAAEPSQEEVRKIGVGLEIGSGPTRDPTELDESVPDDVDMQREEKLKNLHEMIKEEIQSRAQQKQLVNGEDKIKYSHEIVENLHEKVEGLITNNNEISPPCTLDKLNKMLEESKEQQKLDIQQLHKILDSRDDERVSHSKGGAENLGHD